jgi:RNA polymerase sigma-70 factor (ECF subfamily)
VQDEQRLVKAAQRGDAEAFAKLYESYFERVLHYVVARVGNRAEAEDLAGDVFIRAYEALGTYQWRGLPFSTWLFRIAHNRVVDYLRKLGSREVVYLEQPSVLEGANEDPDQELEAKWSLQQVLNAMVDLTISQRQVIALRFASGMSLAETAKVMGKNEGAIKALQHSAVKALRRAVERRGQMRTGVKVGGQEAR